MVMAIPMVSRMKLCCDALDRIMWRAIPTSITVPMTAPDSAPPRIDSQSASCSHFFISSTVMMATVAEFALHHVDDADP